MKAVVWFFHVGAVLLQDIVKSLSFELGEWKIKNLNYFSKKFEFLD